MKLVVEQLYHRCHICNELTNTYKFDTRRDTILLCGTCMNDLFNKTEKLKERNE